MPIDTYTLFNILSLTTLALNDKIGAIVAVLAYVSSYAAVLIIRRRRLRVVK